MKSQVLLGQILKGQEARQNNHHLETGYMTVEQLTPTTVKEDIIITKQGAKILLKAV